jgi:hypothetical protein
MVINETKQEHLLGMYSWQQDTGVEKFPKR